MGSSSRKDCHRRQSRRRVHCMRILQRIILRVFRLGGGCKGWGRSSVGENAALSGQGWRVRVSSPPPFLIKHLRQWKNFRVGTKRYKLRARRQIPRTAPLRSEEHTSELQSRLHLVCRLLLEKKKKKIQAFKNLENNYGYT